MLTNQQQVVKESNSRYSPGTTLTHKAKKVALVQGIERRQVVKKCNMLVHLQVQCLGEVLQAPMDLILIDKVKSERPRHSPTVAVKW